MSDNNLWVFVWDELRSFLIPHLTLLFLNNPP